MLPRVTLPTHATSTPELTGFVVHKKRLTLSQLQPSISHGLWATSSISTRMPSLPSLVAPTHGAVIDRNAVRVRPKYLLLDCSSGALQVQFHVGESSVDLRNDLSRISSQPPVHDIISTIYSFRYPILVARVHTLACAFDAITNTDGLGVNEVSLCFLAPAVVVEA
ncbi:hypothetical protein PDIDSM_3355 [Penicillium digitatum]|nr:hypothetical protein PDIDSM_3355 [Penicillium digitatum]